MRILLLAQFVPPVLGGEERHVWALARTLAARDHDVTLLGFATGPHDDRDTVEEGVRIVRVRTCASRLPLYSDPTRPHALPLPDPLVARAIHRELATGTYDVVHAHNWIVNSAIGPAARAGVPLVMTLHDYSQVCVTKRFMDHGRAICAGPAPRRCLSCATDHYGVANGTVTFAANTLASRRRRAHVAGFAAVSSAVREIVSLDGRENPVAAGVAADVVPNFIPDDIVVDHVTPAAPDAPLLFVGDLSRDKGVAVLLDAYRRLPHAPELVLAGRTVAGTTFDLPVGVRHAGALPHHEVVALFRAARAVIVPSVWPDPCPTVVLEAMAAGRPVVAAASGGIVDMVVDGVTGSLVPAGDAAALATAIDGVLAAPADALRMGTAGRDRVRTFTVSAVVDRIEQMYAAAIGRTATGVGSVRHH